jgi:hypothetical protein
MWQDEQETKRMLAPTDGAEMKIFYEQYCKENINEGLNMRRP